MLEKTNNNWWYSGEYHAMDDWITMWKLYQYCTKSHELIDKVRICASVCEEEDSSMSLDRISIKSSNINKLHVRSTNTSLQVNSLNIREPNKLYRLMKYVRQCQLQYIKSMIRCTPNRFEKNSRFEFHLFEISIGCFTFDSYSCPVTFLIAIIS